MGKTKEVITKDLDSVEKNELIEQEDPSILEHIAYRTPEEKKKFKKELIERGYQFDGDRIIFPKNMK